jgi:monovalent cation:H+ antiporter-2, CPA2 family
MEQLGFLQDLAVVMIVAGVVTIVFHRLKQPVVLGYIIAGMIIGPYTPPFPLIKDEETIKTLSQLGLVFLMFSLGIHFNIRKLKEVGIPALVASSFEILFMISIGYVVGRLFGWSKINSLFLGAILSISSTTIIIKTLGDMGRSKEKFAELIYGILIVEDILGIAMIALLSSIAETGSLKIKEIIFTFGKLTTFFTIVIVVGMIVVPKMLRRVSQFRSNEMLLITVLGLCFGISLLAIRMGYSVALGAFLSGVIISECRESGKVSILIEPVRDLFSAIFFVSIGLLIEPKLLIEYALPIAVITCAVVIGKVLTCSFGTYIAGYDTKTSLRVGMGLAQIGEFSFIIASLGLTLKVTEDFLYPIAVTVSAITTLLTPYLIRSSDAVEDWFDRIAPQPVVRFLDVYTSWIHRLNWKQEDNLVRKLIRKWVFQLILNVILITGVFLGADYIADEVFAKAKSFWFFNYETFWLTAALIALPLCIATLRKLHALGMLLAELSTHRSGIDERILIIRRAIANAILFAGAVGLALWIWSVSAAFLPTWPVLIVFTIIILFVAFLLWRSLIQVYSKAQIALHETLSKSAEIRGSLGAGESVSTMLSDAEIEDVLLTSASPACGKLIRELQLRSRSGASIVGIERNGKSMVNPEPDEELQSGDRVVLVGQQKQIDSAVRLLVG